MNKKTLISFITVNYNGIKDTCELIQSIHSHITSVDYEIIVVDNASVNNEAADLQNKFPTIIAIRSEKNLGFAGGNNLGIKIAQSKYLFFINNDTLLKDDKIKRITDRLESNSRIAGVSPKIKDAIAPFNLQFAGFTKLSSITLRNKTIGQGCPDEESYNKPYITPYLHGAAMCIKKEAIEKVGLMPESFFLYYEELDWSMAFTRKGYELWYEPECTIYHKESQSTGKISTSRTYYLTRNRLLLAYRNLSGLNKWISIIYQICIASIKNMLFFLIKGKGNYSKAVIKGVNDFIILKNKKF